MRGENRSLVTGLLLILLGFLFLANNLNWLDVRWDNLWPYLVIFAGLLFWGQWVLNRTNPGVLMPGTILLTYGLLFLYCTRNGWNNMDLLWPVFLLGPGLGFFAMYVLGSRDKGLLVPGSILVGLSLIFFIGWERTDLLWPIILIMIGIILLLKARSSSEIKSHRISDAGIDESNEVSGS